MVISGFDYQMYQDEIAELREEMTQLLLSMEYKHQTMSRTQFQQWWEGEGHLRRYYECKGRIEQIESYLSRVQVEETEYPKMRKIFSMNYQEILKLNIISFETCIH